MNQNDDARIAHERLVAAALEVARLALADAPDLMAEFAGQPFGGLVTVGFGGDHASVTVSVARSDGKVCVLSDSECSLQLTEQPARLQ